MTTMKIATKIVIETFTSNFIESINIFFICCFHVTKICFEVITFINK